jgi:CheY-like chemotaxis protein
MTMTESSPRGPRVLIIDDDVENRRLLREVLEAEELLVVGEGSDGGEAVDLVAKVLPDVVLMDLRMPSMGGLEATRLIRESSPFTQVLVLTSYDGPLPTRSAEQVGAYAYLVKGCSPQLIRDVILQAWKYGAGIKHQRHMDMLLLETPPPA